MQAFSFSNKQVSLAAAADSAAITALLNSAYRGESSTKGWTTEAHLIAGNQRTDAAEVQQVLQQPGSVFLKYTAADNPLIGCVNLQLQQGKLYLGMFSVSPLLQGAGIGKQLLQAAEEYAGQKGIAVIYMSVISLRTELINWYIRHGYRDTGKRIPFMEDGKSGKHLQPLEFMILEKNLTV
jgi:ribosomal protein S18 acetylase RimI-like enzyme